ncbi:EamA family transporter [Clostridium aminobutyricum]|uniref:EamA family transporter n=1 Tax=Clostridium aminobutyricum TaxID=33953 RepID=A0A939IIQ3_CLOAM|nr:EamA family transporter [Clostridium aminobutyricum]MBN7772739.1 EamA family transporter [Clostridium aminobutyricum]
MLNYYVPIIVVVAANTLYHICAKAVPQGVNAFASLIVTYLTAAFISFIIFLVTSQNKNILIEVKELNWASLLLGFSIVGLEFGFLLLYRVGWNISIGSLVCNIVLAVVLIIVGVLVYKEHISMNQVIGIALCIGGLIFINK